jgi:hypothetical protein
MKTIYVLNALIFVRFVKIISFVKNVEFSLIKTSKIFVNPVYNFVELVKIVSNVNNALVHII